MRIVVNEIGNQPSRAYTRMMQEGGIQFGNAIPDLEIVTVPPIPKSSLMALIGNALETMRLQIPEMSYLFGDRHRAGGGCLVGFPERDRTIHTQMIAALTSSVDPSIEIEYNRSSYRYE